MLNINADQESYSLPKASYADILITKHKCIGSNKIDPIKELQGFADCLLDCRIIEIKVFSARVVPRFYFYDLHDEVLTGVEVTYKNIMTGVEKKIGRIALTPGSKIGEDVYVYQGLGNANDILEARISESVNDKSIHTIGFKTKTEEIEPIGRRFRGFNELEEHIFDFNKEDRVIVGICGDFEGEVHGLGFYSASRKDLAYWKRRTYILMKAMYKKNEKVRDEVENVLENIKLGKCEADVGVVVFGMLLKESPDGLQDCNELFIGLERSSCIMLTHILCLRGYL